MEKQKKYRVYIQQHYKPIEIMAYSKDEAEHKVQNDCTWGEPIDVEIIAIRSFDSKPTNTGEKDDE